MKKTLWFGLLLILSLWCGLAVGRTFYNISKVYREERGWIGLKDEQKRYILYKNIYPFSQYIAQKPESYSLYLYTTDGEVYYLTRYLIYPKKIYWADSLKKLNTVLSNQKNVVVFTYNSLLPSHIREGQESEVKDIVNLKKVSIGKEYIFHE